MAKETKTKALESRLGNNIGYCPECKKKHPKGKHSKEKKGREREEEDEEEGEEKMNKKEINGDQED